MTGSDHPQSPGLRYHVTNCRDNRVTTGMARCAKQGLDDNSHLGICIYVCFTTGTVDPQVYPILRFILSDV